MKAKLLVEGKEFDIEIQDPELQKLIAPPKQTGYERVDEDERFYSIRADSSIFSSVEGYSVVQNTYYNTANYYSSEDLAENNARADELMRQLRRFAVVHRENKINWNDETQCKYYIYNDDCVNNVKSDDCYVTKIFGSIYFDTKESADLAIETFHDELLWYFTEYKDSL